MALSNTVRAGHADVNPQVALLQKADSLLQKNLNTKETTT
jgi:hypothetical protein